MQKNPQPFRRLFIYAVPACLIMLSNCAPCQPYGSRANPNGGSPTVTSCCTSDPAITRADSGFCEGGTNPAAVAGNGRETSIAFVPAWTDPQRGPQPAHLVTAYNADDGLLGWSFSRDQGRTWTARHRNDGGPGGNSVPDPAMPFRSYGGDPSIVAVGPSLPGVVAMVTLGSTVPCANNGVCPFPDIVILLVSTDGGETFSRTSIVNSGLGIGITDQPRVTVDSLDGTIWVLWRARTPILPAPFFDYIRAGHLESGGAVSWDINDVGRLASSDSTPDYQFPRITVFTRPGSRTHTVAIVRP